MPRASRRGAERIAHPRSVAATDLALLILSSFSYERPELGISELAELLGQYRSRVHRAVTTLVHRGFLVRNPASEKYRLGIKLFELGNIVASQMDLLRDAAEPLTELSRRTNATVWLVQRDGDEVIDLMKVEPPAPLLVRRQVGSRTPLTFGVVGQVYLAHLPEQEVDRLLSLQPAIGQEQRVEQDHAEYKRHLETVRRQGYTTSIDGIYPGITSVAAPVHDHTGSIAAVVALSAPTTQVPPHELVPLALAVRQTAEAISRRLGFVIGCSAQPGLDRR